MRILKYWAEKTIRYFYTEKGEWENENIRVIEDEKKILYNFVVVGCRLPLFGEGVVRMTKFEKISLAIQAMQLLATLFDVFFK